MRNDKRLQESKPAIRLKQKLCGREKGHRPLEDLVETGVETEVGRVAVESSTSPS